ncbi:MAG: pyridoxal phosphate-dependent aminotransferase [Rhizobiaceae bacterium]|nr:pyridoxal phosphate-dependent aminotransferase [Rhizobiaceae bacterium]
MSKSIPFTKIVSELPHTVPFVGPEAQERNTGIHFRARLGANESCFGPSPKAIAAMTAAGPESWRYGDPENHDLRVAIAAHHSVSPSNVMIGEGIDGLLGCMAHMFVEPGVNVVTSLGSYPTFNFHIKSRGGDLDLIPYVSDHEDLGGLIETASRKNAAIIYVSNPNNPMGTWHDAGAIKEMIANLPSGTVLALDEAYIECAPEGVAPEIYISNPQVLRFRTFSKAYGLAGMRVGYVLGHEDVISAFDKVRNHYGMNRTGQIGALEALKDQAYLMEVNSKFSAGRSRIETIASAHGMETIKSVTNFVAIDCGRDSAFSKDILARLLAKGIFIRMPGVEPQSRCIRVSVGLDHELDLFEEAFAEVLKEVS